MHEHQFYSENLDKCRRIRIYTPYGYKEDAKPYGFLVLTDGDDYINVLSAVTVLDNLIYEKKYLLWLPYLLIPQIQEMTN